jgi:hypothetical protein
MRRVLLITLSLVLALVAWSSVCAEDNFYVIPAMRGKYAPVPKTGQTYPSDAGTDGALLKGVAWPTPRFIDNNNGTVTDKLTGLIWMKDANAFLVKKTWAEALSAAATLANGIGGLTDGSKPGDWRLPNVREFLSLVDYGWSYPALPDKHPFLGVQQAFYWSSTTYPDPTYTLAWGVYIGGNGKADWVDKATANDYVWCVRDGK